MASRGNLILRRVTGGTVDDNSISERIYLGDIVCDPVETFYIYLDIIVGRGGTARIDSFEGISPDPDHWEQVVPSVSTATVQINAGPFTLDPSVEIGVFAEGSYLFTFTPSV